MRFCSGLWHFRGQTYVTLRDALQAAWDRAGEQKEAAQRGANTQSGEAEQV